jgi:hypothetical protein
LTLFDDINANEIGVGAIERAIAIADYYTNEARRLHDIGYIPPEITNAKRLLKWLHSRPEDTVGLKDIYQLGPGSLRTAAKAKSIVRVLEEHGWIIPMAEIPNQWRVVRGEGV